MYQHYNSFVLETLSREELLNYIEWLKSYYEEKLEWMTEIDRDLSEVWLLAHNYLSDENEYNNTVKDKIEDLSWRFNNLKKS